MKYVFSHSRPVNPINEAAGCKEPGCSGMAFERERLHIIRTRAYGHVFAGKIFLKSAMSLLSVRYGGKFPSISKKIKKLAGKFMTRGHFAQNATGSIMTRGHFAQNATGSVMTRGHFAQNASGSVMTIGNDTQNASGKVFAREEILKTNSKFASPIL
jgi:hypothetical protein